jgi:lipopolysaccharide/colanic/teichoic acid biosynthesis glycosyltransferase
MRIITLGNGNRVELGRYLAGIRYAKANPTATFKHGLTGWWTVTGADIMRQFRDGVMDRINQGISYAERGKG